MAKDRYEVEICYQARRTVTVAASSPGEAMEKAGARAERSGQTPLGYIPTLLTRELLIDREVDRISAAFPLGAKVRYFPVRGREDFTETSIRSVPYVLGHGKVMVKVEGMPGGVDPDHLSRLPA